MGVRFGTECYADDQAAATAQCASVGGVTASGYLRCIGLGSSPTGPTLQLETLAPDGAASSAEVAFVGQACDPFERYGDLAEMWGYAVPAVLAVVLVREFIYRHVMPQ